MEQNPFDSIGITSVQQNIESDNPFNDIGSQVSQGDTKSISDNEKTATEDAISYSKPFDTYNPGSQKTANQNKTYDEVIKDKKDTKHIDVVEKTKKHENLFFKALNIFDSVTGGGVITTPWYEAVVNKDYNIPLNMIKSLDYHNRHTFSEILNHLYHPEQYNGKNSVAIHSALENEKPKPTNFDDYESGKMNEQSRVLGGIAGDILLDPKSIASLGIYPVLTKSGKVLKTIKEIKALTDAEKAALNIDKYGKILEGTQDTRAINAARESAIKAESRGQLSSVENMDILKNNKAKFYIKANPFSTTGHAIPLSEYIAEPVSQTLTKAKLWAKDDAPVLSDITNFLATKFSKTARPSGEDPVAWANMINDLEKVDYEYSKSLVDGVSTHKTFQDVIKKGDIKYRDQQDILDAIESGSDEVYNLSRIPKLQEQYYRLSDVREAYKINYNNWQNVLNGVDVNIGGKLIKGVGENLIEPESTKIEQFVKGVGLEKTKANSDLFANQLFNRMRAESMRDDYLSKIDWANRKMTEANTQIVSIAKNQDILTMARALQDSLKFQYLKTFGRDLDSATYRYLPRIRNASLEPDVYKNLRINEGDDISRSIFMLSNKDGQFAINLNNGDMFQGGKMVDQISLDEAQRMRVLMSSNSDIANKSEKLGEYKISQGTIPMLNAMIGKNVFSTSLPDILNAYTKKVGEITQVNDLMKTIGKSLGVTIEREGYRALKENKFYGVDDETTKLWDKLGLSGKYFSNDVADRIESIFNSFNNKKFDNAFVQAYDSAMMYWKGTATVMNVAFHGRNFISNMYQNFLAGVTNPKYYNQAADILAHPHLPENQEWLKAFRNAGLSHVGFLTGDISPQELGGIFDAIKLAGKSLKSANTGSEIIMASGASAFGIVLGALNQGIKAGHYVGERVENLAKLTHFISKKADGLSDMEAANSVRKYLFDYSKSALTDYEKNIRRWGFPFYSWMRNNLPLQVEKLFTDPSKQTFILKIRNNMETLHGNMPVPDYMEVPIYIGTDKRGTMRAVNLNGLLPLGDLNVLMGDGAVKYMLQNMNPFVKYAGEELLNLNFLSGKKITSAEGFDGWLMSTPEYNMFHTRIGGRLAHTARMFRMISELQNLDDGFQGIDKMPIDKAVRLAFGSIYGTYTKNEVKRQLDAESNAPKSGAIQIENKNKKSLQEERRRVPAKYKEDYDKMAKELIRKSIEYKKHEMKQSINIKKDNQQILNNMNKTINENKEQENSSEPNPFDNI